MAIPVNMKPNGDYAPELKQAFKTDKIGRYTEKEILAKCKKLNSIKSSRKKEE